MHEDEEDNNNQHPYWYAKVLRIFYMNSQLFDSSETEKMDFLWIHWFEQDPDHAGGFKACHLYHIGLIDPKDPSFYLFLNPSNVLWAAHLIPTFLIGRLVLDPEANKDNADWEFYYLSMYTFPFFSHTCSQILGFRFINHDMFIWYLGHGIEHKVTASYTHAGMLECTITPNTESDLEDNKINIHDDPRKDRYNRGKYEDIEEVESVDADKEADFGHRNQPNEEGNNEQDKQEDDNDNDNESDEL